MSQGNHVLIVIDDYSPKTITEAKMEKESKDYGFKIGLGQLLKG